MVKWLYECIITQFNINTSNDNNHSKEWIYCLTLLTLHLLSMMLTW